MATRYHEKIFRTAGSSMGWHKALILLALCMVTQWTFAQAALPKTFETPDEAVSTFVKALRANDKTQMNEILGPDGEKLINSGDEVADRRSREWFVKAYNEAFSLLPDGDKRLTLVIGKREWPYPIPLVKSNAGWYFDTQQGDDEILARRIGRNEYAAVRVLMEIVESENEYAAINRNDEGKPVYASKIVSTEGQRDGLYWPTTGNEPISPIGELVAAAANEGYSEAEALPLSPYYGYLYRILTKQGKDAKGGELEYVADGRMTRGFAAIAYPARYKVSGVMSFIVNKDGQIYQKDLGPDTSEIAAAIDSFNPDASWKPLALPVD